jgi:hypothetical protein
MNSTTRKGGYEKLTPLSTILGQGFLSGINERHENGLRLFNQTLQTIGIRLSLAQSIQMDSIRFRLKVSRSISTTGTPILKRIWEAKSLDTLKQNNTLMAFLQVARVQYGMRLEVINESGHILISTEANQVGHNRPQLASSF